MERGGKKEGRGKELREEQGGEEVHVEFHQATFEQFTH